MEQYGIEDLHLRRIELESGLSVCGFEGCVAYRRDHGEHGPAYSQRKAARLVRKLPPADVLICHCPPFGVNDDPDDPAHVGFVALREWVLEHRPRLLMHGHTHPNPATLDRPPRRHAGRLRQRRAGRRPARRPARPARGRCARGQRLTGPDRAAPSTRSRIAAM